METKEIILILVIQLILLYLNGFFSSTEMALVSLNETKIKLEAEEGNKKSRTIYNLIKDPSRFLSTIQIGITLANLLAGTFAAGTFAEPLAKGLINSGLNIPLGTLVAIVSIIITLVLAFFTIVFGELVPKRLAIKNPEKIARRNCGFIKGLSKAVSPFVWLLTKTTKLVTKIMGITIDNDGKMITEDEIRLMISAGEEKGTIEEYEKEMINNVFEFNDTSVDDLMTHRSKVIAIADNASLEEIIKLVTAEKYSRYPVYHNNIDDIIGVLHIKDLLCFNMTDNKKSIKELMRKPYFVPEGKLADDLLREMKSSKNHLAVVVDEYGLTAGIITMEDLIEEIVGRIYDEHDTVDFLMQKIEEDTYLVNGMLSIDELNKTLDLELPDDEYDTFAGFIIGQLGYIPAEGEKPAIEYKNLKISVEQTKGKTISLVKLTISKFTDENEKESENS